MDKRFFRKIKFLFSFYLFKGPKMLKTISTKAQNSTNSLDLKVIFFVLKQIKINKCQIPK